MHSCLLRGSTALLLAGKAALLAGEPAGHQQGSVQTNVLICGVSKLSTCQVALVKTHVEAAMLKEQG